VILALGRALGETIAVTMVIGNRYEIPPTLFSPAYTLASVIANEFTEATGTLYPAALIELGLVLILVTLTVNLLALFLVRSAQSRIAV
jgi:phosphate transport system permease protein